MKLVKYLVIAIIVLALGVGIYYAYKVYDKVKGEVADAMYLIPEGAAFVIDFHDYSDLKMEVDSTDLWSVVNADIKLRESLENLDSIYNSVKLYSENLNLKTSLYYSKHFMGGNKFADLLSFSLNRNIAEEDLEKNLINYGDFKKRTFEGEDVYVLKEKVTNNLIHLYSYKGILFLSSNPSLIERIILEIEADDETKAEKTYKILKIAGKDTKANIYINYKYFYRFVSTLVNTKYTNDIKLLGDLITTSVLDVNINNTYFSFNGYSKDLDSTNGLLSTYSTFKAPELNIFNYLPEKTNFIYYQGVEKMNEFLLKRDSSFYSVKDFGFLKKIQKEYTLNLEDYFYPWMKSVLLYGMMESKDDSYVLMDTYDSKEAMQYLNELSGIITKVKGISADTVNYRSFRIGNIEHSYILPALFGKFYSSMKGSFYTSINEKIVFASSLTTMKKYIDNILIDRTMANSAEFESFSEKLNYLESAGIDFNQIGNVFVQYVVNDNGAYTAVNIDKTEYKKNEETVSWQFAMDGDIAKGPFVVYNHKSNHRDVIVFDKRNTMYRIDHKGELLWAIPIAELPLGDVVNVDYFKNGKYQILFNSANKMYMYDLNGNSVETYPISFAAEATASLLLADYESDKNYRIIVPHKDGVIRNYQIDGIETKGWLNPKVKGFINKPIQYYRIGSKDFLLLADSSGNVVFSNRRGEVRIEAQLAFTNNNSTPFYKMNNKFATTDNSGRIVLVDTEGNVEKQLLKEFSPNHYFSCFDTDYDGEKDYFFFDNNTAYVYSGDLELKWSQVIDSGNLSNFVMLNKMLNDSTSIISYNDNHLYSFISTEGKIIDRKDFSAAKDFTVYKTDNKMRLLSVNGRVISSYIIK